MADHMILSSREFQIFYIFISTWYGKGKQGKSRGKSGGKKQKKPEVDILSPAAMLNLYYIAHNVADCLHLRGFRWPGAPKSKKGKNKT
uniref:small lysine-rich protein 1 n=1 Tax=Nyctereutes procyonoides TaxID=34880 RepID=UPI002444ADDC|nr:small lysine-rich protein 1 [Nyctereutes procyonoides]